MRRKRSISSVLEEATDRKNFLGEVNEEDVLCAYVVCFGFRVSGNGLFDGVSFRAIQRKSDQVLDVEFPPVRHDGRDEESFVGRNQV